MTKSYDAIVIGAGIIGTSVSFELAKLGWKTLNLDKLPAAGYGSTGASCAVIRVHYSTLDGTALAFEGYHYWKNWKQYLEIGNDSELARFVECGCMVYQTPQNNFLQPILEHADQLAIPYERWSSTKIKERMPIVRTASFSPAKSMKDPTFGESNSTEIYGAIYFPTAGYINDPQLSAQNVQRAAESKGADYRFNETVVDIVKINGQAAGVTLSTGEVISSKVVVNVAGPHSMKINAMIGAELDMNISTRALKVEVAHVPSPDNFAYENNAFVISDSDIGCYSRPELGNHILVGSEDPECDERIFVDPDDWDDNFTEQWETQVYRQAQRYPDLPVSSPLRGVVSLYDVSDDWMPIYDRSYFPGFYMASGPSGNQYKNGPVAGKLMAQLIEYCEAGNNHDQNPLQFHLENINYGLSTRTMSRLRNINPESSFSVLG